MDNQFYPTPKKLANKMLAKFNGSIGKDSVVLEPSAGRGSLIKAIEDATEIYGSQYRRYMPKSIDVLEIDPENIAILRDIDLQCVSIVGYDFMEFEARKMYTHAILNPPFNQGAEHVLRAWDALSNGQLVAIISAETVKNPKSRKEHFLVDLINDNNGTIEYLQDEFITPETKRKTAVEIALIHICKVVEFKDSYIEGLKPSLNDEIFDDVESAENNLAIPEPAIDQAVRIYNAAATSLKDQITISAQLSNSTAYYFGLLADSMIRTDEEVKKRKTGRVSNDFVVEEYNKQHATLKEKAWSHVLTASNLTSGLSSDVVKNLRNEFIEISKLEFTKSNIHGFLANLAGAKQVGNMDMLCSVFDAFTKYATGNRAHYRGWKSNDKHKTNAYQLKTTRFIMKMRNAYYSLDYRDEDMLNDFDLAFAMLDGKQRKAITGVSDLMRGKETLKKLKQGERLSAEYFDIRYYAGAGTMHLFPTNKPLVERLNRMVGHHRQWLPPTDVRVSDAFWLQYEGAEKIQAKMDKDPVFKKYTNYDLHYSDFAEQRMSDLIDEAGKAAGFKMDNLLDSGSVKLENLAA